MTYFLSSSPCCPPKGLSLLYCKGQTLQQTLGMHGCLVLTFLSNFISHHLLLFTCFSDLGVSPEYWEVSVSLLWSSVFCVEFYWPTSLPRGIHIFFSRLNCKFHLLLEVFTDLQAKYISFYFLLSRYFDSNSVRACIIVFYFSFVYKLVSH